MGLHVNMTAEVFQVKFWSELVTYSGHQSIVIAATLQLLGIVQNDVAVYHQCTGTMVNTVLTIDILEH